MDAENSPGLGPGRDRSSTVCLNLSLYFVNSSKSFPSSVNLSTPIHYFGSSLNFGRFLSRSHCNSLSSLDNCSCLSGVSRQGIPPHNFVTRPLLKLFFLTSQNPHIINHHVIFGGFVVHFWRHVRRQVQYADFMFGVIYLVESKKTHSRHNSVNLHILWKWVFTCVS